MARSRSAASKAKLERDIAAVTSGGDVTIVVAWTEDVRELAPGQKAWRHDLGERPKWVDAKKAHAAIWLNHGGADDVGKAQRFIQNQHAETGRVYTYPTSEKDPLGRARRDVLR